MLLAVDTATRTASLALYDQADGRVLGEEVWVSRNNHTVELMPRLVRLMEQQDLTAAALDGLVVSMGPGSFTGLRIGLGLAKGLALARGLPLVGVPTLDVVARPHMAQRLPIVAILQAGRKRICVGQYVRSKRRWHKQGPFRLTLLRELCKETKAASLFCGELDAHDADVIRESLGATATIASPAASLRRATYLAELGWERLSRGDSDDAATLSPIYLHHPQIDA
jgi:tRNA threonylcarbamoyladenosine biosynthesis protein TsaB